MEGGGVVEQKGLKEGALGFVSSVVIGVASTETFVYLEMCKQLYTWGARARETAHVD